MKKMPDDSNMDELESEYRFDYSKAKPNRFAERAAEGSVTIVLDPDVAAVFTSTEEVNAILRALIQNMPSPPQQKVSGD